MAYGYSPDPLPQYRFPRLLAVKTLIRLSPVIERWRALQRRLLPPRPVDLEAVPDCRFSDALEAAAAHFREHRWAFVEPCLDPEFHAVFRAHWPERRYFTAPFQLYKSYDKGFRWVLENQGRSYWDEHLKRLEGSVSAPPPRPDFADDHPLVRALFEYLRGDENTERLTRFTGRPQRLHLNRFQLTRSYPGTFVAPHKDTTQPVENWINVIIFVDGTGGPRSGGLAILEDNTFEKVVFEAGSVRNSCLIYDPAAPFFHGFEPIAFKKYRLMVGAEFLSEPIEGAGAASAAGEAVVAAHSG